MVRPAEADGVVRALAGRQQLEAMAGEPYRRGQVNAAEVCEASAEQVFEWRVEDREDGYAEKRLPV